MKYKKRLHKGKVIITFIITVLVFYLPIKLYDDLVMNKYEQYTIIKEDNNENYAGQGQEKVLSRIGYFTLFHSKDGKTYKEYKQNYGPWKNKQYWQDTMSESGCGITSLAIILSGYGIEQTPETLWEKYYPHLNGQDMSHELAAFGIDNSDFYYDKTHLSQAALEEHLADDKPVLICVWNKPDENRWTTTSHYMVLLACAQEKVYVSNPNGGKDDSKSSGWYSFSEIEPYIAKAMYIE